LLALSSRYYLSTLSAMTSPLAMTLVVRAHLSIYALSPNTAPAFNLAMVTSLGLFFFAECLPPIEH
jgi:hypothetical protein